MIAAPAGPGRLEVLAALLAIAALAGRRHAGRFVGQSSLADRVDSTPLRALTLSMSALDTASRE